MTEHHWWKIDIDVNVDKASNVSIRNPDVDKIKCYLRLKYGSVYVAFEKNVGVTSVAAIHQDVDELKKLINEYGSERLFAIEHVDNEN